MANIAKRLFYRLRYTRHMGPLLGAVQNEDDFSWKTYTTDCYQRELLHNQQFTTRQLAKVHWSIENRRIEIVGAPPLHPGHQIIYETALELQPTSVLEVGCGAGDHLANMGVLLPAASLTGVDVSEGQLEFAVQRNFSTRLARLICKDFTIDGACEGLSAEFVYTNAVLMHIHGYARPLTFLRNVWAVCGRYLLLKENWSRHNYLKLFRKAMPAHHPYKVVREDSIGVLFDRRNALDLQIINKASDFFCI